MNRKETSFNKRCNEKLDAELITERLIMRKFSEQDIEEFYEIVKKNEVGKWLGLGKGMSFEEAEEYVNNMIKHWTEHDFGVGSNK